MAGESLQPGVYACVLITLVAATATLALRFHARRIKNVPLWWDDWFAILSFSGCIVYDVSVFFLITKGLGRHLDDLPVPAPDARYYQRMVQEVEEHAYTIAIGAAQLSLLALYWRLFQAITPARLAILLLAALASTWFVVRIFVAVFQCYPPRFFWDKTIHGRCTVNPAQFFLWSVSTHLALDLALIALPASQISRMSLPLPQKAAILCMFMFGFMVMIASIMMLVVSSSYDSYADDTMWNCTPVVVWSAAEVHLSLMTCCLPILRPVVVALGGWWSQNFCSRRGASGPSSSARLGVRLGPLSRSSSSAHRRRKRRIAAAAATDSTCQLATTTTTASEAAAHETTYIYGQGSGPDTVVEGAPRGSEDEDALEAGMPAEAGIKVKYEVTMDFTVVEDAAGSGGKCDTH